MGGEVLFKLARDSSILLKAGKTPSPSKAIKKAISFGKRLFSQNGNDRLRWPLFGAAERLRPF